jgi:hypothetical protein
MVVYTLASAYWEHATHAELISYKVPTTQPFDQLALVDDIDHLAQPEHAISSSTAFPPSSSNASGFIVSRLIANRSTLELSWVQLSRASSTSQSSFLKLDQSPTLPPVRFEFPNKLIHQPVIIFGDDSPSLDVFALSVTGQLYHLTFSGESLFYAEELTHWSQEYTVEGLDGKVPVLLESIDSSRVIVGCEDGTAFAVEVVGGKSGA